MDYTQPTVESKESLDGGKTGIVTMHTIIRTCRRLPTNQEVSPSSASIPLPIEYYHLLSLTQRVLVDGPAHCLFSGKQGLTLRVIQVYCPPMPCSLSHNSTYTQQHRYFLNSHISECPRILFFSHLSHFLHSRAQAQEQIILMGDLNIT